MENKLDDTTFSTTEESDSVVFSDWTQKLKFDRSFTAKLILSDEKVKEYYAQITTKLLSYKKVKSVTGWSGVSFSFGREKIAVISIIGKTLCLYLAVNPVDVLSIKYKPKDVSSVKKREKTPSLLKIKSDGAKNHAIKLIDDLAAKFNLQAIDGDKPIVSQSSFKTDTFNNLITRGLIRIIRKTSGYTGETLSETVDGNVGSGNDGEVETPLTDVYTDTVSVIDSLFSRHGVYGGYLSLLSDGDGRVKLSKKSMLRAVDEIWVKAIEDCIPSLDELIRNPNHFIAENEEVLPIEKTKRISGRSIAHLCRHTDYISLKNNGEISPTKMLNVFREDSLLTYENKFLNTLINRLYSFVSRRFKVAKDYGADETLQSFEFENNFNDENGKGRIKISVEYSEKNLNSNVQNVLTGSGLWRRVERLNDIVTGYVNSSFAKTMERNFVHPPIMRTNAIIKNKYFRECLALWEFIESYDDAGYGITVEQTESEVSNDCVKEIYAAAAMQYMLFKRNIGGEFVNDSEITSIKPNYVVSELKSQYNVEDFVEDKRDGDFSEDLNLAITVALLADEQIVDEDEQITFMSKTFHAKLRMADDDVKENFVNFANGLLKYDKVKMRHSKRCATFNYGRKILARVTVNGKTLKAYLALPIDVVLPKYNAVDVSDKKAFSDTPLCVKIKSNRGLKYAKELIEQLSNLYGLKIRKKQIEEVSVNDYQNKTVEEMMQSGWISLVKRNNFAKYAIDSEISYGNYKKPIVAVTADDAKKHAVIEGTKKVEDLQTAEVAVTKEEIFASEDGKRMAKQIAGLVRPSANYEKPTDYGLDDASEFIRYDSESNKDE